jgi:hypothetical protein
MNRFEKTSNDLTALAPKWSERGHLLAALPKHLADSQEAIKSQQNIDKEMTDLSLIASAWLKSQQQKELLETRLKRFKETAGYPSMASVLASPAVVGSTNKEQAMNNLDKAAEFGAMMGKSMGKSARVMIMAGNINNLEGAGKGALVGGGLGALGGALYGAIRPGHLNYESSGLDALETTGPEEHRRSYVDDKGNEKHYYVDDKGNVMMKRRGVLGGSVVHGLAGGLLGVLGGGMIGSFSPKSASFGAMMGKIAADPRIFNAPYAKGPGSNGVQHVVNSPAQDAQMRNSTGDADSQLYGLRAPVGFTNHGSEGFSRDKNPKDLYNRDGSKRYGIKVKDSVPASSWRSKPVSYKVDEIQNEKHYNEMTNMNRANPPKDINGVPAARARISNQQDSNAAQTLPYLLSKKF